MQKGAFGPQFPQTCRLQPVVVWSFTVAGGQALIRILEESRFAQPGIG